MYRNCALFSLCVWLSASVAAPNLRAGEFMTGQGARLVVGQDTFTTRGFGVDQDLLGGVSGIAWANGKLIVSDANRLGLSPLNHRVLLFDTTSFPQPTDEIPPDSGRCPVCVGVAEVVLGQDTFDKREFGTASNRLRQPTGVATNGQALAVADTQNNRVLIWNSIPTQVGQPADVVVGQPDFETVKPVVVDNRSLRAPQGVWFQDGRFFVADTQNHRVMIWNSIPTQNHQPADIVLGQPNFNVAPEPDLTLSQINAQANTLLNPVSVSSDGTHLFVADLGHNRVLIWNSIPTQNQQPANIVLGQPDFTETRGNNAAKLCMPVDEDLDGEFDTNQDGEFIYPARCARTMDFPRAVLSDGTRLYIADGGNDRVLVYETVPTENAQTPDAILGQPTEFSSVVTSTFTVQTPLLRESAADVTPTPLGLAWDGENLYVSDATNRRVLVFTPLEPELPINAVRNSASREIFALGTFAVRPDTRSDAQGFPVEEEIQDGDVIVARIQDREYTYVTSEVDTLDTIMQAIVDLIQADGGDRAVLATYVPEFQVIRLQARQGGTAGNTININIRVTEPDDPAIVVGASGFTLRGGQTATVIAPGTLVSMQGEDLASTTASADLSQEKLPLELGGVQAYFDGIRAPLLFVSPDQINAQVPFEVGDSNNVSFYLRIERPDGSVKVTNAIAVPIDLQNPGIFAFEGIEPRQAVAYHFSSRATGAITVDNTIREGDAGIVTIEDRTYTYHVRASDTLATVRDAFVAMINADPDAVVTATPQGATQRILLQAKIPGPAGDGIRYAARTEADEEDFAVLRLTATTPQLCCANVADAPVTQENPAVPGEMIYIYATGLGELLPFNAADATITGEIYRGPVVNNPQTRVNSLTGESAPTVISAAMERGTHALYKVVLQLSPATAVVDGGTQLTISQSFYTSNIVLLPLVDLIDSNFGQ